MGHELTHVVQQGGTGKDREPRHSHSQVRQPCVQRTLGDDHDLTSPRFSRLLDLEEAYDDESVIREGSSGRGVQAIQQALYDLGYPLPAYGADGQFGSETKKAVKKFQKDNPPLVDDGDVGPFTMTTLDTRFGGVPELPQAEVRAARWDADSPAYTCVRSILCPWSPHTIDVLRTRITLNSCDSISQEIEEWNEQDYAWKTVESPCTGYQIGSEIGVVNNLSCEKTAETLYHEVLHAEQPTTHSTTRKIESYAYSIGEEFSIAMGLKGRPNFRSPDQQGREYADPTKVGDYVATEYPGVPAGGEEGEIIGKADTYGDVRVKPPSGSEYTRKAEDGEKVDGPMPPPVNKKPIPTDGWTCP
jgi:peptidoglycan hydrolase-like protein with peptidoglycan-binding domain